MFRLNKLVNVDILFICEVCQRAVTKSLKLKSNMQFDITDLPDGWSISAVMDYFRVYCPDHHMHKGDKKA